METFDIFNIDSQKLADGLNNYISKKGEENEFKKITIDYSYPQIIINSKWFHSGLTD